MKKWVSDHEGDDEAEDDDDDDDANLAKYFHGDHFCRLKGTK